MLIPMTYSVLAVNRRSAYPDDAAPLLSYLLDNQPYDSKLALLPDYAALLPNPAYTEAAQKILDDEALYMQYRATLSPLEQKQAEDILADARAALHQIPPNVYNVSCAPESRASAGIVILGQRRPAYIHPAAASSGRRMHRGDVRAGIDPHRADDDA